MKFNKNAISISIAFSNNEEKIIGKIATITIRLQIQPVEILFC
jgi:hypothetical protein